MCDNCAYGLRSICVHSAVHLTGWLAFWQGPGNSWETCFCVPLQKNKNVRDPFASVTGRRRALAPPARQALVSLVRVPEHPADHCTQRVSAPSGSPAPSGTDPLGVPGTVTLSHPASRSAGCRGVTD